MKTTEYILSTLTLLSFCLISAKADLIYYDGNDSDSSFINSTNKATGMTLFYTNNEDLMQVSGGRRTVDGSGEDSGNTGNEYFNLNPTTGDNWDLAGLYDSISGDIGGGAVEGIMYLSFLVRAHYPASSVSERKDGDLPYGRYFGMDLYRNDNGLVGIGNAWGAHAYSTYGSVTGNQDLKDSTGGTTYISVDTGTHLMVARIAFHANEADDISVWLDPNPQDGNTQSNEVRRYIATAKGDLSFNKIGYKAGNIPITNAVDFDEVRFGTSWEDITPIRNSNELIWYDGQGANSLFTNTTYNSGGLHYQMANGEYLDVSGGKRITPGTGDAGTDTFTLDTGADTTWQNLSLIDAESGLIGGGDVNGVVYFGALVRAQNGVTGTTEDKSGTPPEGTEAYVQLTRPGLNNLGVLGMGNGWNPWAYSIAGVFGPHCDLPRADENPKYLSYNTSVRMMVAKITFKANANDTVTVWLDPNPDNGDSQDTNTIHHATYSGDLSFSQISYRSGNLGAPSAWEFDEVRLATSWAGVAPIHYGTLIILR
ncbi:MAG: hypothetical protein PF904_05700 [Kiritimatiellae bacterium]|jgi:hypothetical protein|nr:hypothetical protein [Kiritimatiellia bacterium]